MKRVLCISPHFPPVNAPDMQRLRQSLPYFREFGWEPIVFAVNPECVEGTRDELLLKTISGDIEIHHVDALSPRLTRVVGLGNLGFRSWFSLRRAVDRYLSNTEVDLVFFTTTVFTSIAHAVHWKTRFGVPFVVDLQDPWRNDFYLTLPRCRRPRKFWFDHWQKSQLERRTMPRADGLITVSPAYVETMRARYPALAVVPAKTVQFGADPVDFQVARNSSVTNRAFSKAEGTIDVVFAGMVPFAMERTIRPLFRAVQALLSAGRLKKRVRLHFIGTDYAPPRLARARVAPLAREYGLEDVVNEQTSRSSYFETLKILSDADLLLLLGSDDLGYVASKFAQTVTSGKPSFAIYHEQTFIPQLLQELGSADYVTYKSGEPETNIAENIAEKLDGIISRLPFSPEYDKEKIKRHEARERTKEIVEVFEEVTIEGR